MYKIGNFSFSYEKKLTSKKIFCQEPFSLPATGLVIISGASGSGKSTLLNLLKGIIPEFIVGNLNGEISFEGKNLFGENFKKNLRKIVYLFQNPYSQLIHKNTNDEYFFSQENYCLELEDSIQIRNELSRKFNLDQLWDKSSQNLSHGECQKLLLASLLALKPKVLLLDEPTAFLDPFERKNFYQILTVLKKDHLIIMVDHHLNEVISIADKMINVSLDGEVKLLTDFNLPALIHNTAIKIPSFENSPNIVITLDEINFSYPQGPRLLDIKKVKLKSGEVISIKGRNGTGKSTLLKLIAGFIPLKKGTITFEVENKKLSTKEIQNQIGLIFQDPESNFLFDTLKEELGQYNFSFTDLELNRSPYLFSEGEKRRISIYQALTQNKNILLYDEPTFGQDQSNIKKLTEIILDLKKMNKLQIIISHDEDFIKMVSDRELIINEGAYRE